MLEATVRTQTARRDRLLPPPRNTPVEPLPDQAALNFRVPQSEAFDTVAAAGAPAGNRRLRSFGESRARPGGAARAFAFLLPLLALGCHGAAYREVYQQKMAGEIRILEDQLYEADYQNQVLVDELARMKARVQIPEDRRGRPGEPRRPGPADLRRPDQAPERSEDRRPTLPARPIPDASEPPSISVPPGAEELDLPDVDLGEPVPPLGPDAAIEAPPGRVEFPDSTRMLLPSEASVPVAVRINPGLSGGHRFDDSERTTGMHLAIEAVDRHGHALPLESPQLRGELTVVLRDPELGEGEAELCRRHFSADELRLMVGSSAGGSARWNVYLEFDDRRPAGNQVLAEVSWLHEDEEFHAAARLSTADAAVAEWNPRGSLR